MSVILDALKKAEADRQRDGVALIRGAQSTARIANNRRRRLWFISLLGTLVCTGAAWFTFIEKPPQSLTNPMSAQRTTGSGETTAGTALIVEDSAKSDSNADDLQLVEVKNTSAFALGQSNSEGATSMSSDAFLPAPAPALMQTSTGAAKRTNPSPNDFDSLPTLAIPNTGAAQPVFAQLPANPPDSSAAALESIAQSQITKDQIASNSATLTANPIAAGVVANSQMGAPVSVPSPDLVLQAAKQTAIAAATVPELYQLDYPTRQALPKLGLTVHVFDPNPARSFVIVNNKRFGEGEQIDGTVLVAKIHREGVECEFNGQRFMLPRQL